MAKAIDKKYLVGLKYRGAEQKVIEKDGRKVTVSEPFERPLEPADVLDWADKGAEVVLVTADGQKVTVAKAGGAKE
jgi:hypothetical protein